jgi:hypothetical protein
VVINVKDNMQKEMNVTSEHLSSVKKSYFNILALFLSHEKIETRFLRSLLGWGFQLKLTPDDLKHADVDISNVKYTAVADKVERLESIYHLVYMIYLDEVVEDTELEIATIYAVEQGFKPELVSDLFKSIATEQYDKVGERDVRREVLDFLSVHEH